LTAYFEIFYAWAKVHLQSVFGNFIKEMFTRISVMILLVLVYIKVIDFESFVQLLTLSYLLRMLVMKWYAFYLRKPVLVFKLPVNYKEILSYTFYIILAGSAGSLLLDIDKFMIPQKLQISQTAFYGVALFIGSVIEAPGRAMAQIVQPLTAKALNEKNYKEVASLYKKSSINLFLVSGLIYLLVNVNIKELYKILPNDYASGVWIVLMISTAKLYHMFLGNNGAIISNSKHYRILLPYSVVMAISVVLLNYWLIGMIGINGAGLSTLLVIFVFNTIKIWFVNKKFGMLPFTSKTRVLVLVLVLFFFAFYFWEFPFHPVINIVLKSGVLGLTYLYTAVKFELSEESIKIWNQFVGFFLKKS
jgi:O-antigen/teichoic acid export membrane protein